jgi:DNA-binding SARP family transcriptional activator
VLTISLLGSPEVRVDGNPLDVDTRKAVALLVYLAVEGGGHPRDRLVELLWPDTDPERSRSSLRRTLSTLRTALGGRWVSADRTLIGLDRAGVTLDIEEFARMADDLHGHDAATTCPRCLPEMHRAAALFRGEFLSGFALRDAPEFESWVRVHAEQTGRRADRVLQRLAAAEAADGDYASAIATTDRRIGLDPLHEEAYRSAMLLRAWSGDRSSAVETYRRLVATLDTELGVSPLEETTELYEAILEEDLPRAPAPPRRPLPTAEAAVSRTLPLVGRDHELAKAMATLASPGGIVLVTGGLGIGTSRFLVEMAARLRNSGATVLEGSGVASGARVPFGVIHDSLLEVVANPAPFAALPSAVLAEASRLFPALSPTPPPPAETGTRTRFLDAIARFIGALPRPVLVIDDAHHCDESSAELLSFLAARSDHFGVGLMVARASGNGPLAAPVEAMLDHLAARGTRLDLTPLTVDDVAALIAAAAVTLDPVALLHRSGGLPLLVVETLRAVAEGRGEAVPDQIKKIYTERIEALRGASGQVLDAVVVLGRGADPDLIAAVSGRSADEADAALDDLAGRGLITEGDDGNVTAVHEHLAAVVAGRHTAARRRLLHRRSAAALEGRTGQADAIRIARHRLAAGEDARAAAWFRTAGDAAAALFAHAEAIDHYEAALAAGHPDRPALHRAAAHSALLDGRYQRAIAGFEAALAEGGPDPTTEHQLGEVHRRLRRWDLAAAHYDRAQQHAQDPALLAIVAADRAFVESRRAGATDVGARVALALDLAAASHSERALARAENVAGLVATGPERVAHLRAALNHAAEAAERLAVLNNLAAAVPDPGEAVAFAREALRLAIESGDRHLMAALHNTLADALHRAGEDAASRAALTDAVALFSGIDTGAAEPWVAEVWLLTEW